MSGLEAIGFFLGLAPLIIAALEGYQKLGKKRDAFKRKSLHIDRMVRALNWQQKLIHSDVKIVMRNAFLDETTIDQHVGIGRYQDLLKRQDIQDAVSSFLGDNCSAYLEIIQECESTLLHVARAVKGFNEESWVANGSLTGMMYANQRIDKLGSEFWKRVKFSMHKDDLEHSIQEIDRLSQLLERLREKSQHDHQLISQSSSSSARVVDSILRKVQVRALKLYRALARSWTQSCQASHEAWLHLDYRFNRFEASKKSFGPYKQKNIEFNVTLQSCTSSSHHTCVVEVLSLDDFQQFNDVRKPVVSFKTTSDVVAITRRLDVDNVCHILNHCMSTKQSLRLYLVENERLCYEHLPSDISDCQFSHTHDGKMVSLQDLLQDPASKRKLQLKPRVKLAAMMACSALQLHATPWCRSLRNESLLFGQGLNGKIDLTNPFFACTFNGNQLLSSTGPSQAESELLDLGVLILELWHNETMGTFACESGLTLDDTFDTRQRVARKWIAETKDDLLTSIYDAAVRCINCRFDTVDIDLTDHKLKISIFDAVVKPLWENCKT